MAIAGFEPTTSPSHLALPRDHRGRVNSELVVESEMAFMIPIVVVTNIYTLILCLISRLRMDCGAENKAKRSTPGCGNVIVDIRPSSRGFVIPWCAPYPHPLSRALASHVLRSPPTSRGPCFWTGHLEEATGSRNQFPSYESPS